MTSNTIWLFSYAILSIQLKLTLQLRYLQIPRDFQYLHFLKYTIIVLLLYRGFNVLCRIQTFALYLPVALICNTVFHFTRSWKIDRAVRKLGREYLDDSSSVFNFLWVGLPWHVLPTLEYLTHTLLWAIYAVSGNTEFWITVCLSFLSDWTTPVLFWTNF